MLEHNGKQSILTNINSDEYINRKKYMQLPVIWWKNNVTQLNETNLNKMSMGIRDVQQEFTLESANVQLLLHEIVSNSAGWISKDNTSYIKILDYDFDSYDSWKKWKYKSLLNENLEGEVWFIDPIWVQQGIKIYLMKKNLKLWLKKLQEFYW